VTADAEPNELAATREATTYLVDEIRRANGDEQEVGGSTP
jgi:hypothetical protein